MQPGSSAEGQRASSFSKSTDLGADFLCRLQDAKLVRPFQALSLVQAFDISAFKATSTLLQHFSQAEVLHSRGSFDPFP